MSVRKIKDYLDRNKVKYTVITHSPTITAQDIAESAHIPGKELAKVVMLKVNRNIIMAVLPASLKVDFELLRNALQAKTVELAEETEFADLFPGCEVGAMPPFGNLYGIGVIVAESLAEDQKIAFNAGSHRELVVMSYSDFDKLVKPKIISFAVARTH